MRARTGTGRSGAGGAGGPAAGARRSLALLGWQLAVGRPRLDPRRGLGPRGRAGARGRRPRRAGGARRAPAPATHARARVVCSRRGAAGPGAPRRARASCRSLPRPATWSPRRGSRRRGEARGASAARRPSSCSRWSRSWSSRACSRGSSWPCWRRACGPERVRARALRVRARRGDRPRRDRRRPPVPRSSRASGGLRVTARAGVRARERAGGRRAGRRCPSRLAVGAAYCCSGRWPCSRSGGSSWRRRGPRRPPTSRRSRRAASSRADLGRHRGRRPRRGGRAGAPASAVCGRAAAAARRARASRACASPRGAWPPTAVEVRGQHAGPRGIAGARGGAGRGGRRGRGRGRHAAGWARGGGYSGPLVYRDGKPMCPAVGAAFDLMDAAAHAEGVDLVVTSGFRSDAEQAVLFARHPDPKWVAPPGPQPPPRRHRARPQHGPAGARRTPGWRATAPRFGFIQRYTWEPWHWGYVAGLRRGRRARRRAAAARRGGPCRRGSRPACGRRSPRPRRRTGSPPCAAGGAAALRVGLRRPRGEPGRGPGDRPVHARDGARPRPARPLRSRPRRSRRRRVCWPATCARSARSPWRWPPTTRGRGGAALRRRPALPRDPGLRRAHPRARRRRGGGRSGRRGGRGGAPAGRGPPGLSAAGAGHSQGTPGSRSLATLLPMREQGAPPEPCVRMRQRVFGWRWTMM